MEPPAGMADLSTDVPCVWGAETVLVVIPAEGILHCPTKTRNMEAILILLIIYPVGQETNIFLQLMLFNL